MRLLSHDLCFGYGHELLADQEGRGWLDFKKGRFSEAGTMAEVTGKGLIRF